MRTLLSVHFCLVITMAFSQPIADTIAHYEQLGEAAYDRGDYDSAEKYYLHVSETARQNNFPKYLEILNNLGNIAAYAGRLESAIAYYQEALRHIDQSYNPREFEAKILKNIGATYSDLKDFRNARLYLNKAETIAREINHNELIADCLNNRGILYEQADSIDKALDVYTQALTYYRKLGNPERLALVYVNLGVISKNLKKWDIAKNACDSALHYSRIIGNEFYIAATLNNLGNVFSGMNRHEDAIRVTTEALAIARKIKQPDLEQNCLSSLAEQYQNKGDYKQAYLWQQDFLALHDSIINVERVDVLAEMETRFDVEKKQHELERLEANNQLTEAQKERAELYMMLLIIVVIAVVLGSAAMIQIRNLKHKRHQLELVAVTEKQERRRIAQDMHDELGAGISRITWITASTLRQVSDEKIKSSIGSIETIADQLSSGMKSLIWLLNTGDVHWNVLLGRIREMASQMTEECNVKLIFSETGIDPQQLVSQNAARDLFLLCKEAVNNSLKHAGAQQLQISFAGDQDQLIIVIKDDGTGFDIQNIKAGHGLNNIRRRCADLHGHAEISSDSTNGTQWNIKLLISEVYKNSIAS